MCGETASADDRMRRLGITMRVVNAESYPEPRDALAQEWARFLAAAFPDALWMPVPNVGTDVRTFVQGWGIDGLILSGGNDVGDSPLRDTTERCLLHLALQTRIPVFGICRGLQLIQRHFGGVVEECPRDAHVAKRHSVDCQPNYFEVSSKMVNSFHAQGVRATALNVECEATAWSSDGWVEGLRHRSAPIHAVQWHPERQLPADPSDVRHMRRALEFPVDIPLGGASDPLNSQMIANSRFTPCVH